MFLLAATERLYHLVSHQGEQADAIRPTSRSDRNNIPPPVAVVADAPVGTRYQLLRAMRAMARGEFMVVEHRVPDLSKRSFEDDKAQREWLQLLRNPASWERQNNIEPVLVPGTAYPSVIGRILIRSGCCAPIAQAHWVPNLRFFFLTDFGRESLKKTQAWWQERTTLERIRLMILE